MLGVALLVAGIEVVVLSLVAIAYMLHARQGSGVGIAFAPVFWLQLALRHWIALRLAHGLFYVTGADETAKPVERLVVALFAGFACSCFAIPLFGWPAWFVFAPASVLAAILWVRAQSAEG